MHRWWLQAFEEVWQSLVETDQSLAVGWYSSETGPERRKELQWMAEEGIHEDMYNFHAFRLASFLGVQKDNNFAPGLLYHSCTELGRLLRRDSVESSRNFGVRLLDFLKCLRRVIVVYVVGTIGLDQIEIVRTARGNNGVACSIGKLDGKE